jgi:GH24 family phage-related lysozyme (muramidase)
MQERAGWHSEAGKNRVEMQGRVMEAANIGQGGAEQGRIARQCNVGYAGKAGHVGKAYQGRKETWGSQKRRRQERKLRQGSLGGQVRVGRAS